MYKVFENFKFLFLDKKHINTQNNIKIYRYFKIYSFKILTSKIVFCWNSKKILLKKNKEFKIFSISRKKKE